MTDDLSPPQMNLPSAQTLGSEALAGGHAVMDWWTAHFGAAALRPGLEQVNRQLAKVPQPVAEAADYAASVAPGAEFRNLFGYADVVPRDRQQVEHTSSGESKTLAEGINPVNWVMAAQPETLGPKLAAYAGVPAVQAMVSQDTDERKSATFWAIATAGLMGAGHLPGPVRELAQRAFPGMVGRLQSAHLLNDLAAKAASNPFEQQMPDWVSKELDAADEELQAARGGRPAKREDVPPEYRDGMLSDPILYEEGDPLDFKDPRQSLDQLKGQEQARAYEALRYFAVMRELAERGPEADSPTAAILRGVVGWNDALDVAHSRFGEALSQVAGTQSGTKLARIAELGQEAEGEYQALSPAERFALDLYRLSARMSRAYQRRAGMDVGQVMNYVPRIDQAIPQAAVKGGRRAARPLVADYGKARDWEVQQTASGLRMVPRFRTIGDLNAHLKDRRGKFVQALMGADPSSAVDLAAEAGVKLDARDPEIARIIRSKDEKAAQREAMRLFTEKRTSLWDIVGTGHFARQMKSAHTAQAIHELTRTMVKMGDGSSNWAARTVTGDARVDNRYRQLGYRQVDAAGAAFQRHMFAPEVAKWLEDATKQRDLGKFEKVAQAIERFAISSIMYNPMIHGMNMAKRLANMTFDHPLLMAHWLRTRTIPGALRMGGEEWRTQKAALQSEAWRNGVVTPHHARNADSDVSRALGNALGDQDLFDLGTERESISQRMDKVRGLGAVKKGFGAFQGQLWSRISDFGVAVYHLEKEAAMRGGVDEANASRWAARRANTMMGHVSRLDQNPNVHALSRLAFFAPNWWRTFGEQLLPIYGNSGLQMTPELRNYIMKSQAKHIIGMLATWKASGHAFNWLLSGHGQDQNDPGHQDDLEIQRPELLHGLQALGMFADIDPNTGTNPQTGGHAYIENPMGRQERTAAEALGLESGHADWTPGDAVTGSAKVLALRLSPLVNMFPTLANWDLYSSIATGTHRNANPSQDMPNGSNLVLAALQLSPLGYTAQNVARSFQSGKTPMQPTPGPFGTTIPKWAADATQGAPVKIAASLLGVNAPYEAASHGRGEQISDQDYRKVSVLQQQYQTQLTGISQDAMTGKMTPNQWLQQYQTLSQQHAAAMQALMGGTPAYSEGTLGLTADWEGLYQQATDPQTGMVDPDALFTAQDQWKRTHSQAQYNAVQAELRRNDAKNPVLALYHQTLDAYHAWQQQYALAYGISVQQLTAESSVYGSLYSSQPRLASQFLQQHPELRQYYRARGRQFYQSPQGLMYGLFFNSSIAGRALERYGVTPTELLALETGAQ